MFLITDGSPTLQTKKLQALQLSRWFNSQEVVIAGDYGRDYFKPSIKILPNIKAIRKCKHPESVVYFGDREVDRELANSAGFIFVKVKCLYPLEY